LKKKIIAMAIPLEEELLEPFYTWKEKYHFQEGEYLHVIHVVKKNITPLEFGLMESPDESTFKEMAPTLKKFLQDEVKKIIPNDFSGEITYKLSCGFHPEQDVVHYLRKIAADLIVVSTRGKHGFQGLFHSSFTEYMVKFAPCDVYVVRPTVKKI
jgi:nucleotide-binding universal stress UspA family protein